METGQDRPPVVFQAASKYIKSDVGAFAAKAVIAAVVTVATLAISANILVSAVINQVRANILSDVGGNAFWTKVEDEMERLARGDGISPEKKKRIISDVRAISAQWRPFVLELNAAVNAQETTDPTKTK